MDRDFPSLDVVTSALNEEECIQEFYNRVKAVLEVSQVAGWRIVICDNGSTDQTWELIQNLSLSDSRVVGVKLSRTFPLDASYSCGIDLANADLVITMASDLQDPPEFIPSMLEAAAQGYDQVFTRVKNRNDVPLLRRVLTRAYYRVAKRATRHTIMENITDFRLINRKVYLSLRLLREQNRFLRGLTNWVGFSSTILEVNRKSRFSGNSAFLSMNLGKVIFQAVNSILGYTSAPLVWVSIIGAFLSGVSLLSTVIFSTIWITRSVPFAGFGTIVGLISLGFSSLLFAIGVIAQYISLIYEEVKARPIYIIDQISNQVTRESE